MTSLDRINAWSESEAREQFLCCCGSRRWAERMAARRPFDSEGELFTAAEEVWQALAREDWLEAFAAHPRIGDLDALRKKFAIAAWSAGEQVGVVGAGEEVLQALAQGNRAYEARFGHIFIVCATGKRAAEMLALLRDRLGHDPAEELVIAAGEQMKITRLRLKKL